MSAKNPNQCSVPLPCTEGYIEYNNPYTKGKCCRKKSVPKGRCKKYEYVNGKRKCVSRHRRRRTSRRKNSRSKRRSGRKSRTVCRKYAYNPSAGKYTCVQRGRSSRRRRSTRRKTRSNRRRSTRRRSKSKASRRRQRKSSAKKSCKGRKVHVSDNGRKYCLRKSKKTGKFYRVYL